jgi:regulator of sigma E protease
MSASKDEAIPFVIQDANGKTRTASLVPRRNPEDLYPLVGINPVEKLVIQKPRPGAPVPLRRKSPAAETKTTDGTHFQGGDRIIASSFNPANPTEVKEISKDPRDPTGTKFDTIEFMRNQYRMRGKPMVVRVDRDGTPFDFTLAPAWTQVLPGVRFQMGRIAAIRANGPAARAIAIDPPGESGLQTSSPTHPDAGDKIIAIEVEAVNKDGTTIRRRYVDEFSKEKDSKIEEVQFDPLRLGHELELWAENAKNLTARFTVLRPATTETKKAKSVKFDMVWDPALAFNGEMVIGASAPMPLSGFGLAHYVDLAVDAVTNPNIALQKGDIITEVRFRDVNDKGESKPDEWLPLKQFQGASLHAMINRVPSPEMDFKVTRAGQKDVEVTVTSEPATNDWPAVERGFIFPFDTRMQQADGVLEALGMGMHRTWRTVKVIYQTLYATIFRQISAKTMSGPLSIANASYKIAGYDFWQFIIFIGLININLAVVNFLPIPLLDGGHMVFLLYEKIRGKPAPERVQAWALYGGLLFILLLMLFVIYLDVRKLFF